MWWNMGECIVIECYLTNKAQVSASRDGSQSSRIISSSSIQLAPTLHMDLSSSSKSSLTGASTKQHQWNSFPHTQSLCHLEAKGTFFSFPMHSTISICPYPLINEPSSHYPFFHAYPSIHQLDPTLFPAQKYLAHPIYPTASPQPISLIFLKEFLSNWAKNSNNPSLFGLPPPFSLTPPFTQGNISPIKPTYLQLSQPTVASPTRKIPTHPTRISHFRPYSRP
jgi:hypothetical protein